LIIVNMEKTKQIIKLFKGVLVDKIENSVHDEYGEICLQTIPLGFILDPVIISSHNRREINKIIGIVQDELSLSGLEMNNSFHKSWNKIKEATIEQLVAEQILHYMSTYGFEKLGIYSEDTVYIPNEKLDIPELKDGIKLDIIRGYSKEELKEKLLKLVNSGIALKEDTIKDIVDVTEKITFEDDEIHKIRNKEVKAALYAEYGLFPENPVEFLRYMVYLETGKTLLIKNKELIDEIGNIKEDRDNMFQDYSDKYGLKKLAQIFLRYKPIFLAFKKYDGYKPYINKIRKLAVKYHKPMEEDYLNSITCKIKNGFILNENILKAELSKVNIFRKIRLAYALNFRLGDVDSIIYRIRNGSGYATEFSFDNKNEALRILDVVMESVVEDISKNVKGKKIYIPENIEYTLPSTEKQFTGNFPSGTSISVPKDMIFGVHWNNVNKHRIDLDLSLLSIDGKIGWDSMYRSEDRDILFSGDMTSAGGKNGASELFYVKNQVESVNIMLVNYYNYNKDIEVPFKIMVGESEMKNIKSNYMINPNDVVSVVKTSIKERQKVLGIIVTTKDDSRFYFTEINMGKSITSSDSEFIENSKKFLYNFYTKSINLNNVLVYAGASIVGKEDCDIDLSPEAVDKNTFLEILSAKEEI